MIRRNLALYLKKMADFFPVLSVSGPRQSGKTTLVRSVFPDREYVNLERLDDRLAVEEDPAGFLSRYRENGVVIDEAQRVPELFSYLQGIVDDSGLMGKFVLTGSQNFLLLEKVTQSLAGRVALMNLMPFESAELADTQFADFSLNEALYTGFYPVIYDRGMDPLDYYPSYIQTYIERDVRSIKNIGDLSLFQRFVRLCAGRIGQLLDLTGIGNDLGITYKTVRAWISILEASYILFLLYPHHENFNKRLVKSPKLYFYDTGLLCSLLGLQAAGQLTTHYLRGSIFENYVIAELLKKHVHVGRRPDLYFWRDNTGHELDLLVEQGTRRQIVEIKSGATLGEDQFKGLKYYQKLTGGPHQGHDYYLVYGGDRDQTRSHGRVLSWKNVGDLMNP
ncbi:MAG: ATP-binding protein [Gemmatimonadetes bacterium]|jgi:uncharacterized protein|nr:ATP-binding protein [Gemmatimonadota bacterium]